MNLRLTVTAAIATVAASIALHPLIASSTWFWEGVGAVLVVAGVGSLTRIRALPVLVCLVATAAGLLLYLNLVFSWQHSLASLLPTPASVAGLLQLNRTGWSEAATFAPPVPGLRGVTFLAVGGIGLAALFTDLLAVRLRQAAAAGLPLLALFSATVASKAAEPAIYEAAIFCAGVAGYLALLVADGRERIQLWGRLVSIRHAGWPGAGQQPGGQEPDQGPAFGSGQRPEARVGRPEPRLGQRPETRVGQRQETPVPDTSAFAAAARRVGMAAMAAALLLPVLIPGLHVRDLFGNGPGGGGHGGGSSIVTLPDPVVQLNQQLHRTHARTVLNYHTSNANPPYLRVYTLDLTSKTASWGLYVQQVATLSHDADMPGAPGFQDDRSHLSHVSVRIANGVSGSVLAGSHTASFLPLPYPAVKVHVAGNNWAADPATLMVWSPASIGGLKYTVTARDVEPTEQQLAASPAPAPSTAAELALPTAYNSLLGLARQITSGAVTPYDKAVALQQWFTTTGNFSYSLDASEPNSVAGLEAFLLHTKRGFCQQFAFAFAVLARLLGIPARVAVGYTAGTDVGNGNWRVTTSDAHAWPELYFQGAGWLPWEPTPAGTGAGQGTAKPPNYTASTNSTTGPGGTAGQTGTGSTGATPNQSRSGAVSQHKRFVPDQGPAPVKATQHSHGPWLWFLLAAAALGLIILLLPLAARLVTRLRRMMIITRGTAPNQARRRAWGLRAWGLRAWGLRAWGLRAWGLRAWGLRGWGLRGWGLRAWGRRAWGWRAATAPRGTRPARNGPAGTGPAAAGPPAAGPPAAGPPAAGPPAAGPPAAGSASARTAAAATAARTRVHAAWLEIHDDLEDFGIGCPANESPRAVVHRVTTDLRLPQAPRDALSRVAFAEERARYAATLADLPTLRADVTTVRKGVAGSVDARARWRARVLPASKLSALQQFARQALDVFGWIEMAASWLSSHLRPGRHAAEMDGTSGR